MPKKPSNIDQTTELISSTALTLQQFKKEEERKKAEGKQKGSIEAGKKTCNKDSKETEMDVNMEVEAEAEDQNQERFNSPFSIILKPGDFY